MQKMIFSYTRRITVMAGIGLLASNCLMADIAPLPSRNPNRPRPVPQKLEPVKPVEVNPPKPPSKDQKPPQPQPPNVLPDKPVPPQPVKPPAGEPPKVQPNEPPKPQPPPKPSLWQRIKSWF